MKTLFKWIGRFLALFFSIIGIICLAGLSWILLQPALPQGSLKVNEEFIRSDTYRGVADSSLILVQQVASQLGLPSISVAVSIDNERYWAVALGKADIKEEKESVLETQYRAGSISKSMTGLAAAQLAQMGKLEIDAPIDQYISKFQGKPWQPSLRQLTSHTGGIRHYAAPGHPAFFQEQFSQKHYDNIDDALEMFIDDTLQYEPGTNFQYSTHGFTLLSSAMEKATGESYLDLAMESVWVPSKMQSTAPDDMTVENLTRAKPYTRILKRMVHMEGPDPSYKWAGGGILTTPSDLVAMGGAFMTGQLGGISPSSPEFLSLPLENDKPNPQNYAMGFRNDWESELLGYSETVHVMHHGGSSPGGSSFLLLIPSDTLSAAAMTNLSIRQAWPLREAVYKIAGMFGREIRSQQLKYLPLLEAAETR